MLFAYLLSFFFFSIFSFILPEISVPIKATGWVKNSEVSSRDKKGRYEASRFVKFSIALGDEAAFHFTLLPCLRAAMSPEGKHRLKCSLGDK